MAIGFARREKGAWVTQIFVRLEGELDAPLETAISVSEPKEIGVALLDWEARDFVFRDGAGTEYASGEAVADFGSDLRLVVVGQKRLDERRTAVIKLFGPDTSPLP